MQPVNSSSITLRWCIARSAISMEWPRPSSKPRCAACEPTQSRLSCDRSPIILGVTIVISICPTYRRLRERRQEAPEVSKRSPQTSRWTQATASKTLEGAVVVRDSPQVNRVEGRLLLEMRAAMRMFNKANARNKHVPKLVPGDATRGALAPRMAKPAKGEAPAAGEPAEKGEG